MAPNYDTSLLKLPNSIVTKSAGFALDIGKILPSGPLVILKRLECILNLDIFVVSHVMRKIPSQDIHMAYQSPMGLPYFCHYYIVINPGDRTYGGKQSSYAVKQVIYFTLSLHVLYIFVYVYSRIDVLCVCFNLV